MKNRVFTGDAEIVYVAGDLHGDYDSFKKLLDVFEKQHDNSLLIFLGDYADRGPDGIEIITNLNKLLETRDDIIALKGNHEIYSDGIPCFSPSSVITEANRKHVSWSTFYKDIFAVFISRLYVAAIINNVLFVHGGISSRIRTIDDLESKSLENVLLWSDPSSDNGEQRDLRGTGVAFGEDITRMVLSSLGLGMIVRSHEPAKAAKGPFVEHAGKVVTVNSCASYGFPWKRFILKVNTKTLHYEPLFI